MFSDKFGLTQAVLDGRKTMTRRFIPEEIGEVHYRPTVANCHFFADKNDHEVSPTYHIGEIVAIAQSYKEIKQDMEMLYVGRKATEWQEHIYNCMINLPYNHAGWNNKMFVRPDLMPHQIKITGIKVERLQDINHEECLKEGIGKFHDMLHPILIEYGWRVLGRRETFSSEKIAFAALINKLSGKGTWDKNPYVFAYDFKLIQ